MQDRIEDLELVRFEMPGVSSKEGALLDGCRQDPESSSDAGIVSGLHIGASEKPAPSRGNKRSLTSIAA